MPPNQLPHLPREEYEQLAQALQEMSRKAPASFDDGFARLDKTSRWVIWIAGGIAFTGVFLGIQWNTYTNQQHDIDRLKVESDIALKTLGERNGTVKDVIKLNSDVVTLKELVSSIENATASSRNERLTQITAINDRLRIMDAFIAKYGPVVDNIEFMRIHGNSFKEDYERINKRPAPDYGPEK